MLYWSFSVTRYRGRLRVDLGPSPSFKELSWDYDIIRSFFQLPRANLIIALIRGNYFFSLKSSETVVVSSGRASLH